MAYLMTALTAATETEIAENYKATQTNTTTAIERVIREATAATMSLLTKRNASGVDATVSTTVLDSELPLDSGSGSEDNAFLSNSNGSSNLAATITSIRTNVTRVLYMYFQNVTDEFGYGAATTAATSTTTATVAATTGQSVANLLHTAATKLHTHLTNTTTTATAAIAAESSTTTATTTTTFTTTTSPPLSTNVLTTAPSITYPSYRLAIRSYENCSALFANYTQPQQGTFCNWTWDKFLCWPPTPAGVLARMHCPPGWHGIDTRKFASRKCELDGHWGSRTNETNNTVGWTDYQPCFKPEVNELMEQMKDINMYVDIARRTRVLEIVGLVLSLLALILSLIIFCNFRSLRNNRTKIHKNLFIAMVLQVVVRLTLYLDQALRRGSQETPTNSSMPGIENTPFLCEASYVLLEYARTAMFMWMFIEGLYLHNMITVAVFQGRFPHTVFSLLGWGTPVLMTTAWAICMAFFSDSIQDCWWNYNLMPYYWILEGPRLIVILLNFFFLMNIIRVLVVKLRQSQASDIEQTRKAVRAAIVLLPLLGITNLLHLVPTLNEPWKFALWSYVTHFLTSFQGFFIAMIYCFLNGEVRTVLLKSLAVYMSTRGHPEWAPKRASMFSAAYNTAPETEGQPAQTDPKWHKINESPPNKRLNGRKPSTSSAHAHSSLLNPRTTHHHHHANHITSSHLKNNNNVNNNPRGRDSNWMMIILCFRGQKVLRVPPASTIPPESVVFELSEQ